MLVAGLAACGSEECSQPRRGDEQTCDVYDGGQLRFVVDEPMSDVSAYYASPCVDVFAPIAISGYDDLRKVPLLPKVRLVDALGINVDTLRDLRGLEKVDVVKELSLSGEHGDTSVKTLDGLTDEEIDTFSIDQVAGLASVDGISLKRVEALSVSNSAVQHLDLSRIHASYLNVSSNDELGSLAMTSGELNELFVRRNPRLTELAWDSEFVVRKQLRIESNAVLSSCLVQRLAKESDAGAPRAEFIRDNGPCP